VFSDSAWGGVAPCISFESTLLPHGSALLPRMSGSGLLPDGEHDLVPSHSKVLVSDN